MRFFLICVTAFLVLTVAPMASADALTTGASGAVVAHLNQRLGSLGYLPASDARSSTYTAATAFGVQAFQKVTGLQRDSVAGPQTLKALRHASRPHPRRAGGGRRIEVDLSDQVALLISGGRVRRTIAISSGRPGYDTPTGSFSVFRKELRSWSVPYSVWLPYASYFVGGVAFHAYPSVPATAASHGCVRVPEPFAAELYKFATTGTKVTVLA